MEAMDKFTKSELDKALSESLDIGETDVLNLITKALSEKDEDIYFRKAITLWMAGWSSTIPNSNPNSPIMSFFWIKPSTNPNKPTLSFRSTDAAFRDFEKEK